MGQISYTQHVTTAVVSYFLDKRKSSSSLVRHFFALRRLAYGGNHLYKAPILCSFLYCQYPLDFLKCLLFFFINNVGCSFHRTLAAIGYLCCFLNDYCLNYKHSLEFKGRFMDKEITRCLIKALQELCCPSLFTVLWTVLRL